MAVIGMNLSRKAQLLAYPKFVETPDSIIE
jgi:hypothetical protein